MRKRQGHLVEPLSIVIAAIAIAVASVFLKDAAKAYPEATLVVVAYLLLTLLLVSVVSLARGVSDLEAVTTRVTYHDVHGKEHGRKIVFEIARGIVHKAEREILALNWVDEESVVSDEERKARDAYFTELLEKAKHLPYRRVLQAEPPTAGHEAKTIADVFDEGYVEHFDHMLELKKEQLAVGRSNVDVIVAPASVPSTFLIVDDRYLVWQLIEKHEPSDAPHERWRVRGAIVIHDRLGEIIPNFKDTFDRVQQQEDAVKLKPKDLKRRTLT